MRSRSHFNSAFPQRDTHLATREDKTNGWVDGVEERLHRSGPEPSEGTNHDVEKSNGWVHPPDHEEADEGIEDTPDNSH